MTEREADISLGGFSLWLNGRGSEDPSDNYAFNTISYEVRMETWRSSVSDSGAVSTHDLEAFNKSLRRLMRTLSGEAVLGAHESAALLMLRLTMRSLGHVQLHLELRPDDQTENHAFFTDIDQSYLESFVRQVARQAEKYPPKGGDWRPQYRDARNWFLDFIFGKRSDPA